jgi:hypothetical protein
VLADRALAQVQVVPGPLEAAAVGDGHEAPQRCDVQDACHVEQFSRLCDHAV